jgi:hypothetical protein
VGPLWCCLLAGLGVAALACPTAGAQDRGPLPLRLAGVVPGGVRHSATTSWGQFDFTLTNLSDADRQARVLLLYPARPDVQYGRDVWVPAHSTLATWLLAGPAVVDQPGTACDIQVLLYERSGGEDRLVLPPGEERVRSRGVTYNAREPSTTLVLDEAAPEGVVFGALPQPESWADEAVRLVRTMREARHFSERVVMIPPASLPSEPEAFEGIDQLVIGSRGVAQHPAGMQALRRWLERGGRVWVMLDRVELTDVAPLLGDAVDFEVVDRVGLTTVRIETTPTGEFRLPPLVQQHERPVGFARVLLPPGERVRHTVNGWPAWFARDVGRGKVVFTALGPRAWYRDRTHNDPPSPYEHFPTMPMPTGPLEVMADDLHPPREPDPTQIEALRPLLTEEIGYAVVGRGTVGLVCAAFLGAGVVLGVVLRRSRRPELLGWVGPAMALAAAGTFVALGEWSRRTVPATVAVAQVVNGVAGTDEVPVHGVLATFRPDSGPVEAGARQGGLLEPDVNGLGGQTRRFILTDTDAWHWENLSLPAGVRLAPFRYTTPTGEPITAVGRFGPDGIEGRVTAGPFRDLADALLATPGARSLALRLGPDGAFSAGTPDILPTGQFLAGAVLSDRQQRRQQVYRELLGRPAPVAAEGRSVLYAWAPASDPHFTLVPAARTAGSALLALPLRLERPAPGARVTIPGPLIPYQRILDTGPIKPTPEGSQPADMHLRFQLPAEVLPLEVERARLLARIDAPGRQVTVSGRAGDELVELHRVEGPLDPIRVDVTEARLLRLDEGGGLHLEVDLSRVLRDPRALDKWTVEYLEFEVVGRVKAEQ